MLHFPEGYAFRSLCGKKVQIPNLHEVEREVTLAPRDVTCPSCSRELEAGRGIGQKMTIR